MNLGNSLLVIFPVVTIIATALLVLRFHCKRRYQKPFGWDDYLLIVSYLSYLSSLICVAVAAAERDESAADAAVNYAKVVHIMASGSALNILSLILTKVAIIVTLLRITKFSQKAWHRAFLWSIAIMTIMSVGPAGLVFCIETWWGALPEDCIEKDGVWQFGIFAAVWSTVSDFMIAAFSWVVIWKLNMRRSEKICIGIVLSLGVLAGAIGGIKLSQLTGLCAGTDPEKPYNANSMAEKSILLLLWSFVEASVMIMGVAAPNVRMMIREYRGCFGNLPLIRRFKRRGPVGGTASSSSNAQGIVMIPIVNISTPNPPPRPPTVTTECVGGGGHRSGSQTPSLPEIETGTGILKMCAIDIEITPSEMGDGCEKGAPAPPAKGKEA